MLNAALDFSCGELSFAAVHPCGHAAASFRVDLPGRDSSSLPILVGNALAEAGFTYDDIDTWTVGTGPGSFTALRVAAAFVLGASRGRNQTVRGIPSACGFEGDLTIEREIRGEQQNKDIRDTIAYLKGLLPSA